ncbi:ATPase [Candidatus Dependentiae bacterium]|nr:ATPase [Candidatus Dependentiae bacterium]
MFIVLLFLSLVVIGSICYGFYLNYLENEKIVLDVLMKKKHMFFGKLAVGININVLLFSFITGIIWILSGSNAVAETVSEPAKTLGEISLGQGIQNGLGFIAAGLSTAFATIGAGIGTGIVGAAGIGAISEKPGLLGKTLIYMGLAEGIAIYGLLVSFMILAKL